jgi:hypothetical protein
MVYKSKLEMVYKSELVPCNHGLCDRRVVLFEEFIQHFLSIHGLCDRRVFLFEEFIQHFLRIGKDTLNLMTMLAYTTIWSQGWMSAVELNLAREWALEWNNFVISGSICLECMNNDKTNYQQ